MMEGEWMSKVERMMKKKGGRYGEDRCNGVTHNVYNLRDVIKKQNDTTLFVLCGSIAELYR